MSTTRRQLSCTFNGGCGQLFSHQSDLLEHVSGHLGEGATEDVKDVLHKGTCDLAGSDTTGANVLDDSVSPTKLFSYELDLLLPELDESEERIKIEENCPPSTAINMDLVLQPANPCLELVSSEPLPVLDNVNWGELLQNYPSVTDCIKYEQDSNSSYMNDSQDSDEEPEDAYDPLSLSPESILPHDDYRSGTEGGSNDEFEGLLHYCPASDKHGRIFEVVQGKHMYYPHDLPSAGQDLNKFSRGQHQPCFPTNTSSHDNSHPFKQEMVTFVTKEKRTYKAIVTTPTSTKTKQVNRRSAQHPGQDVKYYSSEFILKEGLKKRRGSTHPLNKPYVCPVPGCGKAYKNPNGIKYHARYGHSAPQEFPCSCGKIYSTRHGLMAHRRTHSISSSSDSMDFYSFSEPEESDDYQKESI